MSLCQWKVRWVERINSASGTKHRCQAVITSTSGRTEMETHCVSVRGLVFGILMKIGHGSRRSIDVEKDPSWLELTRQRLLTRGDRAMSAVVVSVDNVQACDHERQ